MNADLLGYFITWTCYGSWLPGDGRGWTRWQRGDQVPQPLLVDWCRERLTESPIILSNSQREIVNNIVREHCYKREWYLHEVNCRTTHCHVVVTAQGYEGEQVRDQLKAWATRRLKNNNANMEL